MPALEERRAVGVLPDVGPGLVTVGVVVNPRTTYAVLALGRAVGEFREISTLARSRYSKRSMTRFGPSYGVRSLSTFGNSSSIIAAISSSRTAISMSRKTRPVTIRYLARG